MVSETTTSLLNIGLITGLSDRIITDIVSNVQYIFCIEDLFSEYIYDKTCAQKILEIVENILENE